VKLVLHPSYNVRQQVESVKVHLDLPGKTLAVNRLGIKTGIHLVEPQTIANVRS